MSHRPDMGEIRSPSHETLRNGIPSPRIEHYDGEVPPALSPLDAFAAQGRLLARQLEESARRDRRLSRLPPSSVARSLSRPRPGYFRSLSSGDSSNVDATLERRPTQRVNPEVEEQKFRPVSEHPRFSSVSNAYTEDSQYEDDDVTNDEDATATPKHGSTILSPSRSFEVPRAESPEEDLSMRAMPEQGPRRFYAAAAAAAPSVGVSLAAPSMNSSTDSASSRLLIPRSLAPPVSPMSRPSSSSRATQPESSDDDYSSSNAGSTFSQPPRKLSSSSAMSGPHSPMSTTAAPVPRGRPPSQGSETSNNGGRLQRPSLNFSRPISRSSTNLSASAMANSEQLNVAGNRASIERGHKPGPIVVPTSTEATTPFTEEPASAVSASYTYAKYPLPRGRQVSRDSVVFAGLQTPHFEWKEPLFESPTSEDPPERSARTPSPPPSNQEAVPAPKARSMYEAPISDRQLLTPEPVTPSRRSPSPETSATNKLSPKVGKSDAASSAGSSNNTLRPQTARSNESANTVSTPVTAEDHLAVGINCHEKGSLKESTYHLRIAAKQNHPTAMLLYALACRHGWGMRPNQTEGVRWLRKAVDSVGLELMGDSNSPVPARFREMQKAYRAQFALSIYELGVSHLNGWGIEQDKSLALRCFEIAGQWGDADALSEAGYCYAQGIGCKKDLKKAAKFYRQAGAKGVNMVGNSWYVSVCSRYVVHLSNSCVAGSTKTSICRMASPTIVRVADRLGHRIRNLVVAVNRELAVSSTEKSPLQPKHSCSLAVLVLGTTIGLCQTTLHSLRLFLFIQRPTL